MKTVFLATAALLILLSPVTAAAQAGGQARAVHASMTDSFPTSLADTGTLSEGGDARTASQSEGSVPNVFAGNTLHAAAVGSSDTVSAEASAADVSVSMGGVTVDADFVMARAIAGPRIGTGGAVSIHGLSVNGSPVTITGQKNQVVSIPGGQLIINEQQTTGNTTAVNALHIVMSGVGEVVVATASAGVQ